MEDCLSKESDIKKWKHCNHVLRIYKIYEFLLKWLKWNEKKKCENLAIA